MPQKNPGTKFLSWQLTDRPYAPNLRASAQFKGTVSVTVATGGVGMEIELTPQQARDLAGTLVELSLLTVKN